MFNSFQKLSFLKISLLYFDYFAPLRHKLWEFCLRKQRTALIQVVVHSLIWIVQFSMDVFEMLIKCIKQWCHSHIGILFFEAIFSWRNFFINTFRLGYQNWHLCTILKAHEYTDIEKHGMKEMQKKWANRVGWSPTASAVEKLRNRRTEIQK